MEKRQTLIDATTLVGLRDRLIVKTLAYTGARVGAVGHLALGSLEWQYPPLESRPAELDAIVVLSGSIRPPDPAAGRPEAGLEQDSLYRCLHAVTLYRQGPPCRVVVSGGHVENRAPEVSCAQVMRDFLIQRCFIYLDPDYAGNDTDRYDWLKS